MQGMILQPWTTVQSSFTTTPLVQSVEDWLDLCDFADATFWVDVPQITGATLLLTLQTSPTQDESYFFPVTTPLKISAPQTTPYVMKTVRGAAGLGTSMIAPSPAPLAKFVRWQLGYISGSTPWSITFRIRVAPSRQSFFVPSQFTNCALWLRADLGVSLTSSNLVQHWTNQTGDSQKDLVQSSTSNQPGYSASTAGYNSQPTLTFTFNMINPMYMVSNSTSWTQSILPPSTFIWVAHNNSAGTTTEYLQDGATTTDGYPAEYISPGSSPSINIAGLSASHSWSSPAVVMSEATDTPSSALYYNSLTSSFVTGTANVGLHSLTFGAHSAAFGLGNYWEGNVAEVIAYNRLLTLPEKSQLRNYLNARYAFSIT
jgi:hypothetical protein